MRPLERQVRTHIGQLLPPVTWHLAQQRPLAVHNFIVTDREHEVLGVGIHHGERRLAVMVHAVDRILGNVLQRIMHPAHVPLDSEAQAPVRGRAGDAVERGGFLGDHHNTGHPFVRGGVHFLQEGDRLEIFAASKPVGLPLSVLA
jgi:hypothetical protein